MLKDFFVLGLNNLKRRKLRSWLTMIGIFIGIAAVVSLMSLGQGLQDYITDEFEKLGSDKIIIQPKGMGPPGSAGGSLILTSKDLKVIENVRGVEWAVGFLIKQGQARVGDESGIGFASGLTPEDRRSLNEIQGWGIIDGRDLKKGDKFKVVVGYNHIYGDIWDKPVRIGSNIEIEGYDFKIVGVMGKIGNPIDDGLLHVDKDILKEVLGVEDEESQIMVKTSPSFDTEEVAETIERKLRKSRGEKEKQETFNVQTSEQLLNTFQNIFAVVQGVLVGIAAISLLVGGIGIMNTMYTSVVERTKEIGTMKAIGAKNSHVLMLFLIESGLLGLVGGLIGVGIGIGLAKGAEYIAGIYIGTPLLQASMSPVIIIGALIFSFVIGTLSGVLPALQASRLKPVDALRYE
ncbi:ABC transporter permease [archaeon]|jgi:putative ABC transport system permease protein|nr:ABC transporter permease [archaeon]MBT4242064.1 ABC transporter permease [archaeon]MBT4417752.1 ABC transporter permease [archaeon]